MKLMTKGLLLSLLVLTGLLATGCDKKSANEDTVVVAEKTTEAVKEEAAKTVETTEEVAAGMVEKTTEAVEEAAVKTVEAAKEDAVETVEEVKQAMTDDVASAATHDVQIFTADNSDGKITPKTIEEAFVKAGFFINDNRDMNPPFIRDFNQTTFDVYNLFTLFKKDTVLALVKDYPNIGLFSPMSMSIYTKKGTKTISVAFLSSDAMAKIMGIPADNKDLVALGQLVKDVLKSAMPNGSAETVAYKMIEPAGEVVKEVVMKIDADTDWEEKKDDFQMAFEETLPGNKFVMAGFNDLNYDFDEKGYNAFNFYDVYSICYIEVIYVVSQKHPEAGAFAPCSIYMYQKKGENELHMAFPTVHKWISSLAIEDKESIDVLINAQNKMEAILEKLTKK